MIIDIRNQSVESENISIEDILKFPDREERVIDMDIKDRMKRDLYCLRNIPLKDKKYSSRIEEVAYFNIDILNSSSEGTIYRRRKVKRIKEK